jgi:cysteine desulfurase/selenocysteine lyase
MTTITYFDNAATSWPKPPAVRAALDAYFGEAGGNPGRAGHRMSIAAAQIVENARDLLAELLNADDSTRIILTKNATEGLNLAIYGLLEPGDHAITSHVEHNSVMRPLRHLESMGVELTVVANAPDGTLDPDQVGAAIKPNTRLITTLHGSNVMGTLLPIAEIAEIARARSVPYLVDASQTAGAIPIDVEQLGVDMVAFTGHKALLGLTGTGGIYIRDGIAPRPFMRGGTGSRSDLEQQPDFLPDAYESGTINVAGFAGLAAGVSQLLDSGVAAVATHERELVARFIAGVEALDGVTVHGPSALQDRCGVLSFNVDQLQPSEVGTLLDQEYAIMSRVGLHCAPGAHQTIGTFPTGSVRFGFSIMNSAAEVDHAIGAVTDIAAWASNRGASDA